MPRPIAWHGKLPNCDFCQEPALYDGKTTMGPWANMCEDDLKAHGYPHSQGLTNKRLIIPEVNDGTE